MTADTASGFPWKTPAPLPPELFGRIKTEQKGPLMAKQRRSKSNHTMTKTHSRIIFSLNSKGGSGNTAAMVALADFLIHNLGLNPKLVDCDLANKTFGSLSHIFKGTPKLDVRTETGLDDLLAIAKPAELEEEKAGGSRIVLADFGGGNEEDTVRWFNEMYDGLVGHDISFLGIGLLTSNVATAKGIISWSVELRDRISYLIIRNHMAGPNFTYLFETEIGRKFFNASNAPVIDMEKRAQNIQNELVNRGLSLRQAIDAAPDVAGPVLGTFAARVRMRGYVARLEEQFATVTATLVPDLAVPV